MVRKILYKVVSVMYKTSIRMVFFVQKSLHVTHNYQPNPFTNNNKLCRDTNDRYDAILSNIDEYPGSLIDLGCNQGFFVLIQTYNLPAS